MRGVASPAAESLLGRFGCWVAEAWCSGFENAFGTNETSREEKNVGTYGARAVARAFGINSVRSVGDPVVKEVSRPWLPCSTILPSKAVKARPLSS